MINKLTRNLLVIILLVFLAPVEMQSQEDQWKQFGVTEKSGDFQKIQLEEWLEARLTNSLARVVAEDRFEVAVNLKLRSQRNKRVVKNVKLSKFGTVATIVKRSKSTLANGIFDKVEKIQVTLIADETLKSETVETLKVLLKSKIPMVAPERISINSFGIRRPGMSVSDWILEFKPFVGGLLLLLFFFVGVFYLMQRVRFHGEFRMAPHLPRRKRPVPRLEGTTPNDWGYPFLPSTPVQMMDQYADLEVHREDRVNLESFDESVEGGLFVGSTPKSEEALSEGREQQDDVEKLYPVDDSKFENVLESTRDNLNLRKIRSAFLTLKIEECVAIAKTDVELAAVMEILLPAAKASKVMSAIPGSQRKLIVDEHLNFDESRVSAHADRLLERIHSYRGQVSKNPDLNLDSPESVAVYIEQVGPSSEEVVFDSLIGMGKLDILESVAKSRIPVSLVGELPSWFLKACLFKMNFQDRVEFLLTCSPKLKEILLDELRSSDRNSFEALYKSMKHQESGSKKSAVKMDSNRLMAKFLKHVRTGTHVNEDLVGIVSSIVDKWLATRTHGLVGRGGKTKKSA